MRCIPLILLLCLVAPAMGINLWGRRPPIPQRNITYLYNMPLRHTPNTRVRLDSHHFLWDQPYYQYSLNRDTLGVLRRVMPVPDGVNSHITEDLYTTPVATSNPARMGIRNAKVDLQPSMTAYPSLLDWDSNCYGKPGFSVDLSYDGCIVMGVDFKRSVDKSTTLEFWFTHDGSTGVIAADGIHAHGADLRAFCPVGGQPSGSHGGWVLYATPQGVEMRVTLTTTLHVRLVENIEYHPWAQSSFMMHQTPICVSVTGKLDLSQPGAAHHLVVTIRPKVSGPGDRHVLSAQPVDVIMFAKPWASTGAQFSQSSTPNNPIWMAWSWFKSSSTVSLWNSPNLLRYKNPTATTHRGLTVGHPIFNAWKPTETWTGSMMFLARYTPSLPDHMIVALRTAGPPNSGPYQIAPIPTLNVTLGGPRVRVFPVGASMRNYCADIDGDPIHASFRVLRAADVGWTTAIVNPFDPQLYTFSPGDVNWLNFVPSPGDLYYQPPAQISDAMGGLSTFIEIGCLDDPQLDISARIRVPITLNPGPFVWSLSSTSSLASVNIGEVVQLTVQVGSGGNRVDFVSITVPPTGTVWRVFPNGTTDAGSSTALREIHYPVYSTGPVLTFAFRPHSLSNFYTYPTNFSRTLVFTERIRVRAYTEGHPASPYLTLNVSIHSALTANDQVVEVSRYGMSRMISLVAGILGSTDPMSFTLNSLPDQGTLSVRGIFSTAVSQIASAPLSLGSRRDLVFKYSGSDSGDTMFTFHATNTRTGERTRTATVTILFREPYPHPVLWWHTRMVQPPLFMAKFQDASRRATSPGDTSPALVLDTGSILDEGPPYASLVGHMRPGDTSLVTWSTTQQGATFASRTLPGVRMMAIGPMVPLYDALREGAFTIEAFIRTAASNHTALVDIITPMPANAPINAPRGACNPSNPAFGGWRIFAGPNGLYGAEVVLGRLGSGWHCATATVNMVAPAGTMLYLVARIGPAHAEIVVRDGIRGAEAVSTPPSGPQDTYLVHTLWPSAAHLAIAPKHAEGAWVGTMHNLGIHNRVIDNGEIEHLRAIGPPRPLPFMLSDFSFVRTAVENEPFALWEYQGSRHEFDSNETVYIDSICGGTSEYGAFLRVVPPFPIHGRILTGPDESWSPFDRRNDPGDRFWAEDAARGFASNRMWFVSGPFDLRSVDIFFQCEDVLHGTSGTAAIRVNFVRGLPIAYAESTVVETFYGDTETVTLNGSTAHAIDVVDAIVVKELPRQGQVRFLNGTLVSENDVVTNVTTLSLYYVAPTIVITNATAAMRVVQEVRLTFLTMTGGHVSQTPGVVTIRLMSPVYARDAEVTAHEDVRIVFALDAGVILDGAAPTIVVLTLPSMGTLTTAGNVAISTVPFALPPNTFTLAYTSAPDAHGNTSFFYNVQDGTSQTESAMARVGVHVLPVDDPIVITLVPDAVTVGSTDRRDAASVQLRFFDPDATPTDLMEVTFVPPDPSEIFLDNTTLLNDTSVTRITPDRFKAPFNVCQALFETTLLRVYVPSAVTGTAEISIRNTRDGTLGRAYVQIDISKVAPSSDSGLATMGLVVGLVVASLVAVWMAFMGYMYYPALRVWARRKWGGRGV